jgi:O-antigen/teichoic acid export membrane protein
MLLGVLLVPITALIASHYVHSLTGVAIVSLLVTEFITSPMVQIAATTMQAGKGFVSAAQIRLVLVVLRTVVLVALFVSGHLTVGALGVASVALTGTVGLVALVRVGHHFHFHYLPGRIRWMHLRTNLLYSVGISAFSFQNDGDKTVLAASGHTVDTGLYAAAYRIAMLGMLPMSSLVNATHQRFLHHEEGVKGQHLNRARSFTKVTAIYGVVFIAGVLIFAPLLPYIIGESFEGSVTMLRWLSPLVLLRTLSIFPINGLMGLGKNFLRTVLIVCNSAVAMTLYILLVPTYSWRGAVAGTMISETLLVSTMWTALVIMQRRSDRDIDAVADPDLRWSVMADPDAQGAQYATDPAEQL